MRPQCRRETTAAGKSRASSLPIEGALQTRDNPGRVRHRLGGRAKPPGEPPCGWRTPGGSFRGVVRRRRLCGGAGVADHVGSRFRGGSAGAFALPAKRPPLLRSRFDDTPSSDQTTASCGNAGQDGTGWKLPCRNHVRRRIHRRIGLPLLPGEAGGEGRGEEVPASECPSLRLSPRSFLSGREGSPQKWRCFLQSRWKPALPCVRIAPAGSDRPMTSGTGE